jgi:acetyl-CoA carboxylase biotin carboxyl carrier protein
LKGDGFMSTEVLAPMEGKISKITVKVGDTIAEDDELLLLEAMKMENPICATAGGVVQEIKVNVGNEVTADQTLVVIG